MDALDDTKTTEYCGTAAQRFQLLIDAPAGADEDIFVPAGRPDLLKKCISAQEALAARNEVAHQDAQQDWQRMQRVHAQAEAALLARALELESLGKRYQRFKQDTEARYVKAQKHHGRVLAMLRQALDECDTTE